MRRSALWIALAAVLGASCAPPAPRIPDADAVGPWAGQPETRLQALLLLLVDRQLYDGYTIDRALALDPLSQSRQETDEEGIRRSVASTLMRTPGAGRALPQLEELATDTDPLVRRRAVYATARLGSLGATISLPRLADEDAAVRRWAVYAAAEQGRDLGEVVARLQALPAGERWPVLLPDAHRFGADGAQLAAVALQATDDVSLRRRAALAVLAGGTAVEPRALLQDADDEVRAAALRAGDDWHAVELVWALGEGQSAAMAALETADRMVAAGALAPEERFVEAILPLLAAPSAALREAALRHSGPWVRGTDLAPVLVERLQDGAPGERGAALAGLVAGRHPRAADFVEALAGDRRWQLRREAAYALRRLALPRIEALLLADETAAVRLAAYRSLRGAGESRQVLQAMLVDPAPAVRAEAFDWLAARPELEIEELVLGLAADVRPSGDPGVQLAAVAAVEARAAVEPLERGALVALLEQLAACDHYAVRLAAGESLSRLDREPPPPGAAGPLHQPEVYRDLVLRFQDPERIVVETERGALEIELDCSAVPLNCNNLLTLVAQRHYSGAALVRDDAAGWWRIDAGGPQLESLPWFVRDEPSPEPLARGDVIVVGGRAHAGNDRLAILRRERPDLEGARTRIGRVVAGLDQAELWPGEVEVARVSVRPVPEKRATGRTR